MVFRDRAEAGRALAEELAPLIAPPCVVAAIPRGGVAVALPIVERLGAPLTVVYARKLTAPFAPEFAFGALDEDGKMILDPGSVAGLGLGPDDVEAARVRVWAEIQRRMALYRVPPLAHHLPGSTVVLVDDGLATGLTMRATLEYARRHGAREITVAVPCAAAEAAERFRRAADRFVSLIVDEAFVAVGAYYDDFSAVTDEEVVEMLARAARGPSPVGPAAAPPDPAAPGLRVSFKNALGLQLAGVLLVPAAGGPHPVVVFSHGWGSGKDSPRNRAVAEALRAAGCAAFLFDFTGHGESEGALQESTQTQQVDDLGAALDLLETFEEVDRGRMGLVGASSGAAVALLRAAEDARIRALVLRSANPEGAEAAAPRVAAPTLLVVGEHDAPIRALNEELLPRLGGPRRLEVVPAGDHLFGDPAALRQAITLAVAWFKTYL
ncbi:MAG: alpha/beta fold hydrolase [Candidatus Rokubacteria bacterium]|nr:alpha/beta fold hydrolase [Candidatus Rokubacteria bacterium]